jgi:hypothetical protein
MVARPNKHDVDEELVDDDLDPDPYEGVHFAREDEARELFDQTARRELGISGEEFLRRWDAGEYFPVPDTPEGRKIGRMVIMIPFARPTSF